jgi:branched-chain amino acid transport system ATP-binding protein
MSDAENLLSIRGVETYYGKIVALKGVDLEVKRGEIVSMIGANGAGKSTLMMTICGNPQARTGQIVYDGTDITTMPTHHIMRRGIAQTPEGRRIFPRMTVMENLQMGAALVDPKYFEDDLKRVFTLFPRLKERLYQRGGTLSGGEQQMLAVARALMTNPSLLLLDEPSEGLAPLIVQELLGTLVSLRETGMTILLAEQNFSVAESMADRVALMERGEIALVDSLEAIAGDEQVKRRYLGVG